MFSETSFDEPLQMVLQAFIKQLSLNPVYNQETACDCTRRSTAASLPDPVRNAFRRQTTVMFWCCIAGPVSDCSAGGLQSPGLVAGNLGAARPWLVCCHHPFCDGTASVLKAVSRLMIVGLGLPVQYGDRQSRDFQVFMINTSERNGYLNTQNSSSWCVVTCNIFPSPSPSRFFQYCCATTFSSRRFTRNPATLSCFSHLNLEYINYTCLHLLISGKRKPHRCT